MTKHEIMIAYISPHVSEIFSVELGFNISIDTPGTVGFITQYADKVVKKRIRAADKAYGFAILLTLPYSQGTDDLNITSMNLAQAFSDWIEAQNKTKNLPYFGTKCKVMKIESLQNMPNVAEVNEEGTVAKYMLQCRVNYYEED